MLIQFEKSSNATGFLNVKRILIKSLSTFTYKSSFLFRSGSIYKYNLFEKADHQQHFKSMLQ